MVGQIFAKGIENWSDKMFTYSLKCHLYETYIPPSLFSQEVFIIGDALRVSPVTKCKMVGYNYYLKF